MSKYGDADGASVGIRDTAAWDRQWRDDLIATLTAERDAARREERERCAKVCYEIVRHYAECFSAAGDERDSWIVDGAEKCAEAILKENSDE